MSDEKSTQDVEHEKKAQEKAPEIVPVSLLQLVALTNTEGAIVGIDIAWAPGVTSPQFGAKVLNELKAQLNDVGRTAEFLSRLFAVQFAHAQAAEAQAAQQ